MARTQQNFRLDDWLKTELDAYCERYGLKKDRMVEALVYNAVVKNDVPPELVFRSIQELADRVLNPASSPKANSLTPAARQELDQALARGASPSGDGPPAPPRSLGRKSGGKAKT